jgi:hypothetical protein
MLTSEEYPLLTRDVLAVAIELCDLQEDRFRGEIFDLQANSTSSRCLDLAPDVADLLEAPAALEEVLDRIARRAEFEQKCRLESRLEFHGEELEDNTCREEWQATEHMRLDEDKLEALRRWGQGLQRAGSEEDSAAGRAILMLLEEIEQLHIKLSHARQQVSRAPEEPHDEVAEAVGEPFASTLHGRVQRVLRRDSGSSSGSLLDPVAEPGSDVESDRTPTSAQAWIEALRREH